MGALPRGVVNRRENGIISKCGTSTITDLIAG